MTFLVWHWYFPEHFQEDSEDLRNGDIAATECSCRQQVALQYLCGILWQLLSVQLGAALLWAAVSEVRDLLQPTHTWDMLLLAECCCHCSTAACSCLLSRSPLCAGSGSGCQRGLQVLRIVMCIWWRNGANCLSLTASPSSLIFPLGVLLLLLLSALELPPVIALSGQRNMQEDEEWKIQKDGSIRRVEVLLSTHSMSMCVNIYHTPGLNIYLSPGVNIYLSLSFLCCEYRNLFAPVVILFLSSLSWRVAEYNEERELFCHFRISGHMSPFIHLLMSFRECREINPIHNMSACN